MFAWLLSLVVIQVIASGVGTKEIQSFRLPGTESQRAYDLLAEHFPAQKGDTDQLVYKARTGSLKDARTRSTIEKTLEQVAASRDVASVASPFSPGGRLSDDGRTGIATLNYKPPTVAIGSGVPAARARARAGPDLHTSLHERSSVQHSEQIGPA